MSGWRLQMHQGLDRAQLFSAHGRGGLDLQTTGATGCQWVPWDADLSSEKRTELCGSNSAQFDDVIILQTTTSYNVDYVCIYYVMEWNGMEWSEVEWNGMVCMYVCIL